VNVIAYYHVQSQLKDGSTEQRIYDVDPRTGEPEWFSDYKVVNGTEEEARAIVRMMNEQFNIEINN
jgi:hypothetical protein